MDLPPSGLEVGTNTMQYSALLTILKCFKSRLELKPVLWVNGLRHLPRVVEECGIESRYVLVQKVTALNMCLWLFY